MSQRGYWTFVIKPAGLTKRANNLAFGEYELGKPGSSTHLLCHLSYLKFGVSITKAIHPTNKLFIRTVYWGSFQTENQEKVRTVSAKKGGGRLSKNLLKATQGRVGGKLKSTLGGPKKTESEGVQKVCPLFYWNSPKVYCGSGT